MCTYMMIASRCIIGYHVSEFFSKFQLKNGHLSRQALGERKEEPGEWPSNGLNAYIYMIKCIHFVMRLLRNDRYRKARGSLSRYEAALLH